MAVITPYTNKEAAQGQLNVNATPDSFGAGVGRALGGIAETGMKFAEQQYQQQAQEDVTNVYKDMADARTTFTKNLEDMANSAQPGDQTIVPRMVEGLQQQFDQLSQTYSTRQGQQEFKRLAADISSSMTIRALEVQKQLAAAGAVNDHNQELDKFGETLIKDPTQLDAIIDQFKSKINNPDTIYGRIPQTKRDEMIRDGERDLRLAAVMGQVQKTPEALLAKLDPDILMKFRMTSRVTGALQTTAPPVNGKVQSLGPAIQNNAQKFGVDANIMTAQIMAESGGNSKSVSAAGAKGVSQFMDDTAAQYGVNVADDNSSIRGQANYMSDLLKMFGGDYTKALAAYNWGQGNLQKAIDKYGVNWLQAAPKETQDYVAKVMKNAGAMSVTGQPIIADSTPVSVGDKNFDALPWRDQYEVIQKAQQQVSANQAHDMQQIAFAKQKREEAQDATLKSMLVQLDENTLTVKDVLNNPTLDAAHTEHMINAIRVKAGRMDDTDPKVLNDVFDRVKDGKITDPDALWDYVGKGISLTDVGKLRQIVQGKGSPMIEKRKAFMSMAKSQISGTNPMMGIADPEGDQQFYKFLNEFDHIVEEKQKAGVPLSAMLDAKEGNKEYLGYLIKNYARTPQERMNAAANIVRQSAGNVKPNVEPRLPGESPDAYLKRTGGGN